MSRLYGSLASVSAVTGFVVAASNTDAAMVFLLGAILFHLWSKDDE